MMQTPPTLLAALAAFALLSPAIGQAQTPAPYRNLAADPAALAAADITNLLAQRWFEIELVVFERLSVLDANTEESLVLGDTPQHRRQWPGNLLQLRDLAAEQNMRSIAAAPNLTKEGLTKDTHPSAVQAFPIPDQPNLTKDTHQSAALAFPIPDNIRCYGYPALLIEDPIHPSRLAERSDKLSDPQPLSEDEQTIAEPLPSDHATAVASDLPDTPEGLPTTAVGGLQDMAEVAEVTDVLEVTNVTDVVDVAEVVAEPPVITAPSPAEQFITALDEFEQSLRASSYLPLAALQLINEVRALNRQQHLRPLLHIRWRQPVPGRDKPQPVYLARANSAELPATAADQPLLQGFVSLTVSRYLHVSTQLWYHADTLGLAPAAFPAELAAPPRPADYSHNYMELRESRRLRSGELHYLDHPKLGVLLQVKPITLPPALLDQQQALVAATD